MPDFYGSQWTGTTSGGANRYFRGYCTYTTSEDANYYYITVSALGMEKTGGGECVMVDGSSKTGSLTVSGASIYSGNPISLSTTSKWSWSSTNPSWKSLGSGKIIIRKTTARQTASCYLNVAKSNGDTSTSWGGRSTGTFTLSVAPYTRTVTFNANGGSGVPSAISTTYGSAYTIPSTRPTKSGYDFLGWSTSSTATEPTYTVGQTVTMGESATLYAVWHLSYVAPTITNLHAFRVVDRTSTVASATGTIGFVAFDYTAPQQASEVFITVRFSTDSQDIIVSDPYTSGEKNAWSVGDIGLNEQATISVTVTGKTYTGATFSSVSDSTYISTQTVVWDAYQNGTLSSFAIGTIADESESRFDVAIPMYLDGERIGDHPVEFFKASDGSYAYRKWASGFCELWHHISLTNSPYSTSTVFGGYQRYFPFNFPTGLWKETPVCDGGYCRVGSGWAIWCGIGNTSTTTGASYYCISNQSGSQPCYGSGYWRGYWK